MQIQTVKTQEMNLLREQQEALTAELQQRRVEHDGLLAQRDDLNSQLQVSKTPGDCYTSARTGKHWQGVLEHHEPGQTRRNAD